MRKYSNPEITSTPRFQLALFMCKWDILIILRLIGDFHQVKSSGKAFTVNGKTTAVSFAEVFSVIWIFNWHKVYEKSINRYLHSFLNERSDQYTSKKSIFYTPQK